MRIYANNFKTKLIDTLPLEKNDCILPIEDEIKDYLLDLLPENDGRFFLRLTLQKEENFEIIDVYQKYGNIVILRAGQEKSTKKEWDSGTFILCAPTADSLNAKRENTYSIDWVRDLDNRFDILEINFKNGNTQLIREDGSQSFDNYPVYISQMSDGDELIVEFAGLENLDRVNILNADEVK